MQKSDPNEAGGLPELVNDFSGLDKFIRIGGVRGRVPACTSVVALEAECPSEFSSKIQRNHLSSKAHAVAGPAFHNSSEALWLQDLAYDLLTLGEIHSDTAPLSG